MNLQNAHDFPDISPYDCEYNLN